LVISKCLYYDARSGKHQSMIVNFISFHY